MLMFCSIGVSVLFSIGRHILHEQAKDGSVENETTLVLRVDEFKRISFENLGDGVKEFEYKGEFYDVFRMRRSEDGNYVFLTCELDRQETELVEAQRKMFDSDPSQKGKSQSSLSFLFYYLEDIQTLVFCTEPNSGNLEMNRSFYTSPFREILSPPPQFI